MIRVIAVFKIKRENIDNAVNLIAELVEETRKEEGCIQYDAIQSQTESTKLVILENWKTQEDLDVHSASKHFMKLVPAIADFCEEAPIVEKFKEV